MLFYLNEHSSFIVKESSFHFLLLDSGSMLGACSQERPITPLKKYNALTMFIVIKNNVTLTEQLFLIVVGRLSTAT